MVEHPCDDHRNALDVHVTATRAALLAHLAHEETEALPLLQRTLSVEENAAFEKAAERAYPLRMIPFLLPWVSAGLPDDVRRRIVDGAGPGVRAAAAAVPREVRAGRAEGVQVRVGPLVEEGAIVPSRDLAGGQRDLSPGLVTALSCLPRPTSRKT